MSGKRVAIKIINREKLTESVLQKVSDMNFILLCSSFFPSITAFGVYSVGGAYHP